MRKFPLAIGLLLLSLVPLLADEGHPVAIRHWPDGGFTIETMWDLHVGMGIGEKAKEQLPKPLDFEIDKFDITEALTMHRLPNSEKPEIPSPDVKHEMGFHVPDDFANDPDFEGLEFAEDETLRQAKAFSADTNSIRAVGRSWMGADVSLKVDGIHIINLDRVAKEDLKESLDKAALLIDEVVLALGGIANWHLCVIATDEKFDEELLDNVKSSLRPEILIVNAKHEMVGGGMVAKINHNTLSIAKTGMRPAATRLVSLGTKPYQMTEEVAELFKKKEASQRASAEFYATLSVEQMNFKPSNGTHTPRWNTEHMMGRELLFFSQIYNAVDPTIPVMDLNPKQMPKDYKFAHPDWTGAEEARQTQRVQHFTRRFAYLLDGLDLDKRAPGSRFWTPRALLKQMERHYTEHTGNTRKKMELPDWPKSK